MRLRDERWGVFMALLDKSSVDLFALHSNPKLAEEIANYIGIPLSECAISRFADGEVSIDIKNTVRGHDCFVIQSTCNPVNENYMELLIMMDALKRASAKSINVVMPYYGYSRQDRKAQARQPISAKLVADLLMVAGATRVLCMDLHAGQLQGFYDIPIDNLESLPKMVSYIKKQNIQDIVIVSPDHGGAKRARRFAQNFVDVPMAIIDKRRPKPNEAEVMSIIGNVKGKNAIIVDDIIDTAGSAVAASVALKKAGAKDIYMCVTHAVLSNDAVERINNSPIKELIVTNTIPLDEDKKSEKITVLSVAKIFGQGIVNIVENKPISELFQYNPKSELNQ